MICFNQRLEFFENALFILVKPRRAKAAKCSSLGLDTKAVARLLTNHRDFRDLTHGDDDFRFWPTITESYPVRTNSQIVEY